MRKRTCSCCASLAREVTILRADLARIRAEPPALPLSGCGDGACVVSRPTGMHTNGGCHCEAPKLRAALEWWRRYAQFLTETIRSMREAGDGTPRTAKIIKITGPDGEPAPNLALAIIGWHNRATDHAGLVDAVADALSQPLSVTALDSLPTVSCLSILRRAAELLRGGESAAAAGTATNSDGGKP